jgi:DNA repair exonuclease SbcCD ATPase subunit
MGDLDNLVDMGFDRAKAELALKKGGGNLTGAIDYLDKNANKSLSEMQADDAGFEDEAGAPALSAGETAASMLCNECGKKFRSMAQAQFHAERSGHVDFAESTEEIAPLTEEEKKARLEELRQKLAEKRAGQANEDKLANKRNEEIRRKHTKEHDDAKEQLQQKERIKEAAAKKQEKLDDAAAKRRIKEKIEADKAARKAKAEQEKAMRENPEAYNPGAAAATTAVESKAAPVVKANHTEARLKLMTGSGPVTKTFAADTTLFEVAEAVGSEVGTKPTAFESTFPRKTFAYDDFGLTVKEAGLVPSAVLNCK